MRVADLESVPELWDDARDPRFFRITAGLFPADFCEGASALLAANDDDEPGSARGADVDGRRTSPAMR